MKPLNRKNYGSIGHLPSSRLGPGDKHVHEGQARIATEKARDRHDLIIVTEKLDGSNVGIARVGDQIHALGRSGWLAQTSPYRQHQLFADWVRQREPMFLAMLNDGERLVGEWLAQAHGCRYALPKGPFAAFDLMTGETRASYDWLAERCAQFEIPMPKLLHIGQPLSVEGAMKLHGPGDHGCLDEPEGAVWRVERRGAFDFMAKWVRQDKVDGSYLPERNGGQEIWNWTPEKKVS